VLTINAVPTWSALLQPVQRDLHAGQDLNLVRHAERVTFLTKASYSGVPLTSTGRGSSFMGGTSSTGHPAGGYPHSVTAGHELPADLAAELSQLVAQAAAGEVVYLTRNGHRVGALVPVETAEALQVAEDEADRQAVAESLAEPGPDIPHEQVIVRYAADLADYPAEPQG
jgi:prevent-host-death family protein